MHILIANNMIVAYNHCVIDWGWTCVNKSQGIFKNLAGEEVKYINCKNLQGLMGHPIETELYIIHAGMEQRDIDYLSAFLPAYDFKIMRDYGSEGQT